MLVVAKQTPGLANQNKKKQQIRFCHKYLQLEFNLCGVVVFNFHSNQI